MSNNKGCPRLLLLLFLIIQLLSVAAYAAECSKTKLCATGCCSSAGYCGTSKDHCGKGCLSTCDFKTECDKDNPCDGNACCSKFGHCGLGPEFCGKDCVAGCDSKGECDPGGFGSKFANHTKCPLNVCCSKHGYCGTTKDFCGKKTVNRPSCSSKGSPMRRVVGYIEGWASTRSCDRFNPSDIPDGVYTHINFAFASIDPSTFQIVPSSSKDPELYRELTRKKKIDPKLKVYIAIGGWAFNDPGPTVTTFSDIARSDTNQRTFIKSLISFMSTYGFDGVDIDWEYPAADDRQGREEDFDNLPKFLSNIKTALKQSGERNGLSIAIPASYWYLQHFDLEKISKHVDHFNVMTYDLHGAWDTPKSWLGNHLNSHTNLTEIKDAFDLLWRNKVSPDQVNMGLAFYARTFSASSSGCMSPGCLFDAGGPAEPCTNAVGVMSNPEIMRQLGSKISQSDLDKTAAVKIVKFGRTWLTYDDVDTWKLKLDFARSQCLGGAMVWAISQDTPDGKFSKQLQQATGYKSKGVTTFKTTKPIGGGVFLETTESEANADVSDDQCHWTNCAQTCPSGWSTVLRRDLWGEMGEIMMDETGCSGNGMRTFCCPPGEQPHCQWESLNYGKCNPGCTVTGEFEVASFAKACNNDMTQTACCRGDTPALDLYRNYKWYGEESTCATDLGVDECGWSAKFDTSLVSSWSGSGAQICYDSEGKRGTRPLCEDTRDATKPHYTNCDWSDDFNLGLTDIVSEGQCSGNCPSGKVKVTLQSLNNKCGKGTSAYCCDVGASFDYTDIDNDDMEDLIKQWVKNPTCPKFSGLGGTEFSSRSLDDDMDSGVDDQSSDLAKRQGLHTLTPSRAIVLIVKRLMELPKDSRATRELRRLVTKYFTPIWPHVTGGYIAGMMWEFRDNATTTLVGAWNFVCHIDAAEKLAKDDSEESGGTSSSVLFCDIPSLDTYDRATLADPREETESTFGNILAFLNNAKNSIWPFEEILWSSKWFESDGIDKRGVGAARTFPAMCPDKTKFRFQSETYTNGGDGEVLAKKNGDDKMYYVKEVDGDCISAAVQDDGEPNDGHKWVSEHILELQTVPMFIEYSMGVHNKLTTKPSPSKLQRKVPTNSIKSAKPPCSMWKEDFMKGFPEWNSKYTDTPRKVLFELLGSTTNAKHMVNAEAKLNGLKAKLWDFNEPIAASKWRTHYGGMKKASAQHGFEQLILVEQVFGYLLMPEVNKKLIDTHKEVKNFLDDFETLYRKQYPQTPVLNLSKLWTTFIRDLFSGIKQFTKSWLKYRIDGMLAAWKAAAEKRLGLIALTKSPAAAGTAMAHQKEAVKIMEMAQAHKAIYSSQVDKFKPDIMFK